MEYTAPVIAVSRLRMKIDGPGVTTLVCFHGCPLRCHWCLNPFSFAPESTLPLLALLDNMFAELILKRNTDRNLLLKKKI